MSKDCKANWDAEWIKFSEQKPPINTDVLVWVADDFNCHEIGRWDGKEDEFCNGWDTNGDLAKYRKITHWAKLIEPPSF